MSVRDDGEFQRILEGEVQAENLKPEDVEFERLMAEVEAEMTQGVAKTEQLRAEPEGAGEATESVTATTATTPAAVDAERSQIVEDSIDVLTRDLLRDHPAPDRPVVRLLAETAARSVYLASNAALTSSTVIANEDAGGTELDLVRRLQHLQGQAAQNAHHHLLMLDLIARRHEAAQDRIVHRVESRRRRAGSR